MNDLVKQPIGIVTTTNPMTTGFNFFDPVQFDTMQRVCKMFATSDLVPDNYKANLQPIPANADENTRNAIMATNSANQSKAMANCMIAIEISMRIGASPLMVMQNMVPIYGKPSWSSKFLIATVNSCGRFEPLQYRFTEKGMLGKVDYTDYQWDGRKKVAVTKTFDGSKIMDIECVAYTTKKGSKDVLESSPVTIRLAIQEGWYTKNGSKWQTMPRQMLMYRAASWWTSAYAPELSMGMRTVEEQQDIQDVEFEEIKTTTAEQEKAATANKTHISVDLADPESDMNVSATVDTTTGEIKQPTPTAPEPSEEDEEETPATPGF